MTTLRKAAQQALEALENISNCYAGPHDSSGECASCHEPSYMPHAPDCKKQNAITALRDALAQEDEIQEMLRTLGFKVQCPESIGITLRRWRDGYAAALAQEEQEQGPVAWMTHGDNTLPLFHKTFAAALCWGACPTPLYTRPPRHDIAYESACGIINEQDKKLAELEAVNAELLGALCALVLNIDAGGATLGAMYDARAAIAKAEGQT
jgi:hypothetical protein